MGIKPLKCTIVSGAPVENYSFLKENVDLSSFIIAADSGYVTCRNAGIPVNLIIGDFDSSPKPTADCEIITLPCEKDDTDTFSCIKEAIKRGFDEIAIFCAAGSRLDHTYSNIVCLDYCNRSNIYAYILNENNMVFVSSKDIILKDDLFDCFREFSEYFGQCRFSSCTHTGEKGCAICKAVEDGKISESRHSSYVQMYNDAKNIKEWELNR